MSAMTASIVSDAPDALDTPAHLARLSGRIGLIPVKESWEVLVGRYFGQNESSSFDPSSSEWDHEHDSSLATPGASTKIMSRAHSQRPSSFARGGGSEHISVHWEAASAFYLSLLVAVGALFLFALLTHPPTPGGGAPSSSSSRRSAPVSAIGASKKGSGTVLAPSLAPSPSRSRAAAPAKNRGVPAARRGAKSDEECSRVERRDGPSAGRRSKECIATEDESSPVTAATFPVDEASFLRSKAFPDSAVAERRRFLNARDGDVEAASEMLRKYLDWRKDHAAYESKSNRKESEKRRLTDSEYHWSRACEVASKALGEKPASPPPSVLYWAEDEKGRPKRSRDGRRILQHLPARIDTSIASGHFYALALALFLDRTLDRTSDEKFCVVIDARPGTGWGNVPAPKLVSFIKHAAALLNGLHPERMAQCVLFPIPFWAKGLWNMIKPFLDPDTAEKICLVSGSDKVDSEPPTKLTKYFDRGVVDLMEKKRLESFEETGDVQ